MRWWRLHHLARLRIFYPEGHLHAPLLWRTNWKREASWTNSVQSCGGPLPPLSLPPDRAPQPSRRSLNLLTTMIPAAATTAFVTSQRVDAADGGCSPFSFSRSRTHLSLAVSGMKKAGRWTGCSRRAGGIGRCCRHRNHCCKLVETSS